MIVATAADREAKYLILFVGDPANREINRENRKIRPEAATRSAFNAAAMGVFSDIPREN